MDQVVIFMFASIIIVGGLLFAVISLTKNGRSILDKDRYRSKWMTIEQQLQRDQPASYHLTVINADKLLDQALRERGLRGQTMAERMKSGASMFTNRNHVWTAHKLRNQIAHEPDVHVTYDIAKHALSGFKQALKDVGAL
jgi:hypothetical protein